MRPNTAFGCFFGNVRLFTPIFEYRQRYVPFSFRCLQRSNTFFSPKDPRCEKFSYFHKNSVLTFLSKDFRFSNFELGADFRRSRFVQAYSYHCRVAGSCHLPSFHADLISLVYIYLAVHSNHIFVLIGCDACTFHPGLRKHNQHVTIETHTHICRKGIDEDKLRVGCVLF